MIAHLLQETFRLDMGALHTLLAQRARGHLFIELLDDPRRFNPARCMSSWMGSDRGSPTNPDAALSAKVFSARHLFFREKAFSLGVVGAT